MHNGLGVGVGMRKDRRGMPLGLCGAVEKDVKPVINHETEYLNYVGLANTPAASTPGSSDSGAGTTILGGDEEEEDLARLRAHEGAVEAASKQPKMEDAANGSVLDGLSLLADTPMPKEEEPAVEEPAEDRIVYGDGGGARAVPPRDHLEASRYAQHLPFQVFCCESGTHVVYPEQSYSKGRATPTWFCRDVWVRSAHDSMDEVDQRSRVRAREAGADTDADLMPNQERPRQARHPPLCICVLIIAGSDSPPRDRRGVPGVVLQCHTLRNTVVPPRRDHGVTKAGRRTIHRLPQLQLAITSNDNAAPTAPETHKRTLQSCPARESEQRTHLCSYFCSGTERPRTSHKPRPTFEFRDALTRTSPSDRSTRPSSLRAPRQDARRRRVEMTARLGSVASLSTSCCSLAPMRSRTRSACANSYPVQLEKAHPDARISGSASLLPAHRSQSVDPTYTAPSTAMTAFATGGPPRTVS
ncbi:hypothetical protein B0H11DRAFT_2342950 [Mycena galericulata]|nr:hypothetical protein B0H11DRAFT_2342950 [Mycena galericulata]